MKAAGSVAWRCLQAIDAYAPEGLSNAALAALKQVGCAAAKNVAVATGTLSKKGLVQRTAGADGEGLLNFITEAGTAAIAAGAIPRASAGKAPPAAKKTKPAKRAKKTKQPKPAKKKAPKKTRRAARPAPASEPSGARFWLSDEVGLRIEADGCTGDLSPAATQRLAEFVFRHFDHEAAA